MQAAATARRYRRRVAYVEERRHFRHAVGVADVNVPAVDQRLRLGHQALEHLLALGLARNLIDALRELRVLGSVEERVPREARERLLRQESGAVERTGAAEGRADDTLHPCSENKRRTSALVARCE